MPDVGVRVFEVVLADELADKPGRRLFGGEDVDRVIEPVVADAVEGVQAEQAVDFEPCLHGSGGFSEKLCGIAFVAEAVFAVGEVVGGDELGGTFSFVGFTPMRFDARFVVGVRDAPPAGEYVGGEGVGSRAEVNARFMAVGARNTGYTFKDWPSKPPALGGFALEVGGA